MKNQFEHQPFADAAMARRLARGIVAIIVTTAVVGYFASPRATYAEGLPDLGDSSDATLSEPQERAIGKRIMLEIRGDRAFVDDPELKAYIGALGNRMVAASRGTTNDNRRDFEFFLLNDETINAFALLGGFIGIHSGLMLTTTTESQPLAAVRVKLRCWPAGISVFKKRKEVPGQRVVSTRA